MTRRGFIAACAALLGTSAPIAADTATRAEFTLRRESRNYTVTTVGGLDGRSRTIVTTTVVFQFTGMVNWDKLRKLMQPHTPLYTGWVRTSQTINFGSLARRVVVTTRDISATPYFRNGGRR